MKITPKQYAVLLYALTKDAKEPELKAVTRAFIKLLTHNHALPLLPRITRLYQAYYNAQEQAVDVEVTVARAISKKVFAQLEKHAPGSVELQVHEDPAVLGGARIKISDYMMDDTLKARLIQLKHKIVS